MTPRQEALFLQLLFLGFDADPERRALASKIADQKSSELLAGLDRPKELCRCGHPRAAHLKPDGYSHWCKAVDYEEDPLGRSNFAHHCRCRAFEVKP